MPDTRLHSAAHHIFDTLVTELTTVGVDVPGRRYVTTGQVAADFAGEKCADAFIVSWTNTFQGIPGSRQQEPSVFIKCGVPLTAQFSVILFRCTPVPNASGKAPTPSQLEVSSDELLRDAMTIPATIVSKAVTGALIDEHIDIVGILGVNALGPQGGVGGCETIILATIL